MMVLVPFYHLSHAVPLIVFAQAVAETLLYPSKFLYVFADDTYSIPLFPTKIIIC
jgi:hypothetical protein